MRPDLYGVARRRVTRLLLWWLCAYVYVGIVVVLGFQGFPIAVVHVTAVVLLAVLCWYLLRAARLEGSDEGPGPELGVGFMVRYAAVSMVSIVLAMTLAVATASAFDEELRREVLAPVTTCERSTSRLDTERVDETIRAAGATIAVQEVIYGVPQRSRRPQPYAYECQQATMVEVVIERTEDPQETGGNLDIYAFKLRTRDAGVARADGSPDEFTSFARRRGLELIEHSSFDDDGGSVKGWMVFPMPDSASSTDQVLAYEPQLGDVEESVALPE